MWGTRTAPPFRLLMATPSERVSLLSPFWEGVREPAAGSLLRYSGTMRQPLGSALLNSQLHHHFSSPTPTRSFPLSLYPHHLISKRNPVAEAGIQPRPLFRDDRLSKTTDSWKLWAQGGVVDNWKECCSEVVNVKGFDLASARDLPQALYEFPDGYHQYFGEERYRFTEMLFDPKNYFNQVRHNASRTE